MGKGKTGKVRFDGLDVAAMVTEINSGLLGKRLLNIYDGVSDADSFLFKLDGSGNNGEKAVLFLESGIRFHPTEHQSLLQQEGMPSPFCSKLRKHLRGLRLERVAQLGNYDRVVHFVFGTGETRHSIILELYARGNLILTDSSYNILALLRSHEYDEVQVKVGQVYPVTYATSIANSVDGITSGSGMEALEWAEGELQDTASDPCQKPKKKTTSAVPLKALLLRPSSGVYHFGPSLIEHSILTAKLNPDAKLTRENLSEKLPAHQWDLLIASLREEGSKVIEMINSNERSGYILYREKAKSDEDAPPDERNGLLHSDKVLEEFQPHLLKQHEGRPHLTYESFAEATDEFYAHLGNQKLRLRAEAAETTVKEKLAKIQQDQDRRVQSLQTEQEKLFEHAQLVEVHAEDVEKALKVINSALDSGMDWDALENLVKIEQQNRNPIAMLIKRLDLKNDRIVLSLQNTLSLDEESARMATVDVSVSLQESAFGNAREMYAKYHAFKEKSVKTLENAEKALKAAEANAKKQLAETQQKNKLAVISQRERKAHWFEKFHWFITSDNYLVLGGKDAHQNELLVKRYLRPGDAYLHADVHGAASCILRAKRRRKTSGKTEPIPLSDQALREAGSFTICRSSAWRSRIVTSAWWVESHQVSKTAPSGEYLTVGSFMVRGKKNFLPPAQLEMGVAVLFRLGDDDSVIRHKDERRDFALMNFLKDLDEEDEGSEAETPGTNNANGKTTSSLENDNEGGNRTNRNESVDDHMSPGFQGETFPRSLVIEGADETKNRHAESQEERLPGENVTRLWGGDGQSQATLPQNAPHKEKKSLPKKGLSVKERKLIKKYGSLEAALSASRKNQAQHDGCESVDDASVTRSSVSSQNTSTQGSMKRGKKGKMKKALKKYADQDEEDRKLALMALHAGEKKVVKNKKRTGKATSKVQEAAAKETAALLLKDSSIVARKLSDAVRDILSKCLMDGDSDGYDEGVVDWNKLDANVLEQLVALESDDERVGAVERLNSLVQSSRVENLSASLSGIIRTIRKYGVGNLEARNSGPMGAEGVDPKSRPDEIVDDGVPQAEGDGGEIDDTIEISKLTGKPFPEDLLQYAVPVCAPYQTVSQYKYRVKLAPGNLKKGKASKQCIDLFLRGDDDKGPTHDAVRDFIKRISDNDWVQVMCPDVKIAAPGASKAPKKQKGNKKKSSG